MAVPVANPKTTLYVGERIFFGSFESFWSVTRSQCLHHQVSCTILTWKGEESAVDHYCLLLKPKGQGVQVTDAPFNGQRFDGRE
jgi:hypothetical protein